MTDIHATSLRISAFRGVRRDLEISFGRRLTIIYGGNATGKSSIAQSMEFALSGQVLDHQDNAIPARYLNNTQSPENGRVTLCLSGLNRDISLSAVTNESRQDIETRFRSEASVDWPERQSLPVTTTHITSQGALARVLKAESVTRNDLAGLCAGAHLRQMLGRAVRLSDYFRQASTGRNVQASLREAKAKYDSARFLLESISSAHRSEGVGSVDPSRIRLELASKLGLPEGAAIEQIAATIESGFDQAEKALASVQRLLLRMRDLGQYEVEIAQLQQLVSESVRVETNSLSHKNQVMSGLERSTAREKGILQQQASSAEVISNFELYQRSVAASDALTARIGEMRAALETTETHVRSLSGALALAVEDQQQKSGSLLSLEAAERRLKVQSGAVDAAIRLLASIDEKLLAGTRLSVEKNEAEVERLRVAYIKANAELREAIDAEGAAERELQLISEEEGRFVKAAAELRGFIHDDSCTLCGHHHGTQAALNGAIDLVVNMRSSASSAQRQRAERTASFRRDKAAIDSQLVTSLATADGALAVSREALDRLVSQRRLVLTNVQSLLTKEGIQIAPSLEALMSMRDDLFARVSTVVQELELAHQGDADSRATKGDIEEDLAKRQSEQEQYRRLAANLQAQLDAIRANHPPAVSIEAVNASRENLTSFERMLAEVRRELGKATAELAEIERVLQLSLAQQSGAKRRLEAIEGLLSNLDAELQAVGATRDVSVLLDIEARTRRQRDEAADCRSQLVLVQQQLADFERHRVLSIAETQFSDASETLLRMQRNHQHLSKRASQFAELKVNLERIQSATAEAVLHNVRAPVALMFRAMTAGCQWDVEFSLAEAGQVEARLFDGTGNVLPATSLLNSAYINVAAIALRIALASQQNWTSLRTVVLDDPILEMDSLTQAALIDGIEAVLMSPHAPWKNLQLILTTWSEDFAILAAHKLAHMNSAVDASTDDFVVYRLSADQDGAVTSERHTPRWKHQANAA